MKESKCITFEMFRPNSHGRNPLPTHNNHQAQRKHTI